MDGFKQLRLQIDDGRGPLEFPMVRLVEYLADFARLIGAKDDVHLMLVEDGSTMPCAWIREDLESEAVDRIRQASQQSGPAEAVKACNDINARLEADNGVGAVLDTAKSKVIEFVGKNRDKAETFGPFREPATVNGTIELVGGKDETVPVWLKRDDGQIFHCETTREMARDLAKHLYEPILASGTATRLRDDTGRWRTKRFIISQYDLLSDDDLDVVVERLRSIEGEWPEAGELYSELYRLRGGEERPV